MKTMAFILVAAVVLGLAFFLREQGGPRRKDYLAMLEPRVSQMAEQRVLVLEAKGDPKSASGAAFGRLYKFYHSYSKSGAPKARWSYPPPKDRNEWQGQFALPAKDSVSGPLPPPSDGSPAARVETWHYGSVAEILHLGPYDAEAPSIDKLQRFITEQGYVIAGAHEEEYLKGPGMFIAGNPAGYMTIIRYPIAPKKGG